MLATLAAPLVCLAAYGAQQNGDVRVGVKAVTVYATVRDKHGHIISNLDKNDFVLKQDGQARAIQFFSQESGLPLTLGLLVDTSLSQRHVLDAERSASYSFLDHILRDAPANGAPKDQAFLIHFDRQVELLQDLTSSRQKLQSALADLHTPEMERRRQGGGGGSPGQGGGWPPEDGGGPQGYPRGGRRGQGWHQPGTLLYDAIYLASHDVMQKQKGRKALIVLSDGVDRGSQETLEEAMEAAQRSDTIVYSILFADNHSSFRPRGGFGGWGGMGRPGGRFPGRFPREERPDGKKILEKISRETGGEMFQVSKKLPMDAIYAQIEEQLRSQYSLAYTPEPDPTPGYHKIELTTKKKGLIVQARQGYYYSAAQADPPGHE
jgi:VWFA-related protein